MALLDKADNEMSFSAVEMNKGECIFLHFQQNSNSKSLSIMNTQFN